MGRLHTFHGGAHPLVQGPTTTRQDWPLAPFFEFAQKVEGEGVFARTVQFSIRAALEHLVEVGTAEAGWPIFLSFTLRYWENLRHLVLYWWTVRNRSVSYTSHSNCPKVSLQGFRTWPMIRTSLSYT